MRIALTAKHAAIGAVAGIAAYASYTHMRDLAVTHGQHSTVAALLPVSVDGMLVVATLVMREDRQAGHRVRTWAWIAFVLGVAASVVANVLAALPDLISRVISAWPAVALLLVIEVLATGKRGKVPADDTVTTAADDMSWEDDGAPETVEPPTPRPKKAVAPRPIVKPTTPDLVAKILSRKPDASPAFVAARIGVSERTAQRFMPRPDDGMATDAPALNGVEQPEMADAL